MKERIDKLDFFKNFLLCERQYKEKEEIERRRNKIFIKRMTENCYPKCIKNS